MAYCTLEDIFGVMDEADVVAYTDDADAGSVDTLKVDQAIASAGSLIDAHLGRRYLVPLDPVPEMVKDLAVDIAAYKIAGRRSDAPEEWRTKYTDAVKLLEKISGGQAVVPGAAAAPSGSGANSVAISSNDRFFGRDKMRGW